MLDNFFFHLKASIQVFNSIWFYILPLSLIHLFLKYFILSNNLYSVLFQVGFCMMCRVKCVAITAQGNIMGFLRVMDAQASSNAQYADLAIMCVRQRPREIALLIKRIGINAAHVGWKNASKLV